MGTKKRKAMEHNVLRFEIRNIKDEQQLERTGEDFL